MEYFRRLQELLAMEQDADRQSYRKLTESSNAAARRQAGIAWYPVAIRGTELGRGDYLTVEVERTTHTELAHQLRFGAAAALFSNHDPQQDRLEGTVSFQGGNRLKLTLRTDELPEWASGGKLGIDLLFDEASYSEMEVALKAAAALKGQKEKAGRLVRVLTGEDALSAPAELPEVRLPMLNESQHQAVNRIRTAQELAIVHGPPGTGKTTTLVQAILQLIRDGEPRVLVTAPSNTAVDLLSDKLSAAGLNVLRVGNPARVSERLMSLTLDHKVAAHPAMKEMKKLKKQAAEFRNMAHKYKRNFGKAEREQRKALFDEAHRIMKDVGNTEQYIIDDLTGKAQVIAATLVGANHYTVRSLRYQTVVIDEAGQALEPACWIPILKGTRLVLAGDHLQLPPTVKSQEAAKGGLGITLLEKCAALHPAAVTLLEEQYRMHEVIMGHSSKTFYEGRLRAHESVARHGLLPGEPPLAFIDTAGCGFEERTEGTSVSNPEEAAFLWKHLAALATRLAEQYTPGHFPSIGVIAPYKEQIYALQELLAHQVALQPYLRHIAVNTIDSFQGQERDIVYISLTRSNTEGTIGFLADTRRMNVAMTRARKKLVVVGDSATLSAHPFYAGFIGYAQEHDAYSSAWEFMD